jgi:hypothetical protein
MNIAGSLVESYLYADMYNREYEGGSDVQEKIYVGGVPVEHIQPSVGGIDQKQEGGKSPKNKQNGPFSNKVVPVGLVLIQVRKDSDVEYEDHYFPGVNREVIPDTLFDTLIGSMSSEKRRNLYPNTRISIRVKSKQGKPETKKEKSRRNRRK